MRGVCSTGNNCASLTFHLATFRVTEIPENLEHALLIPLHLIQQISHESVHIVSQVFSTLGTPVQDKTLSGKRKSSKYS